MTYEGTNANRGGTNANSFVGKTAAASWLYVLVALVGGLIGGALANRLAAAMPALAADNPAKSLAAQEILLVDAKGKPHASLHLNKDGLPLFQMYDAEGKTRIGIGFAKEGAFGLEFADKKGAERVLLSVNDDGVPALRLYDDTAGQRILVGLDLQGDSAIDFYDHEGKLLRELP